MARPLFYNPQDPRGYGQLNQQEQWEIYASLPPAEQEKMLRDMEAQGLNTEFIRGNAEIGVGSGISREGRAGAMYGENIADAEDILAQTEALGPGDYSYEAQQETDPGSLVNTLEHAPEVDPLTHKLQNEAINQARTDSTGVNAQKGVLGEYANLYAQGGLSAIDRARMAQARQTRQIQNRGAQQAIMARAEQMGRAGGNAELLSRLQAQQGSQNALAMDDLQTSALALQRRDALLRDRASLGGQVQSAQDSIDAFNTLGERDRIKENLARENDATDATWAEKNARDREFTQERNTAHGKEWTETAARGSRNADRVTEARRFNVGPNQGARGRVRDIAAANADVRNARIGGAEHLKGTQAKDDAAAGAQTAAWASALGEGGELGLQAYQTFKPSDKKDKDEDE